MIVLESILEIFVGSIMFRLPGPFTNIESEAQDI